jgi:hypothetical protein
MTPHLQEYQKSLKMKLLINNQKKVFRNRLDLVNQIQSLIIAKKTFQKTSVLIQINRVFYKFKIPLFNQY